MTRRDASLEELRRQATRCSAKALSWLKRGAEFERRARAIEKKRDKHERQTWPEEFCEACRKGKSLAGIEKCFLHRKEGVDLA